MGPLMIRLGGYVVLAAVMSPIVGAYDYGTYGDGSRNHWTDFIMTLVLAAIIAAVGEAGLRITRKLRRR